jgi:lipid A 3-O-deacylase PagL
MTRSFLHTKRERATIRKGPGIGGLVTILLLCAAGASAQVGPHQGGSEIQVWTAGGHSVSGGRGSTGILDVGLRYGWVLLDSHGPSFLRGRFEYAIDAVPMYLIFQPRNTAYGIGVNPLNLKWNFQRHTRVVPYAELSGGLLFTNHDVPSRTSSVNFTPSAALGFHYLGDKFAWTLEGRYLHISDAGLSRLNPGINTFEMRFGLGKFRR